MLRELYSLGADHDEPDVLGITAFAAACVRGLLKAVEFLCRISPSLATDLIRLTSGETWPPLFMALGYGQKRVSEFLMSKSGPISLTYRDADGRSALFMAINSGSFDLADSLIRRIESHRTCETRGMVYSLFCVPTKSNVTPAWIAALHGDYRSLEWIISFIRRELKFSPEQISNYIDTCDSRNATPLFVAVQEGHIDCARLLIENRADIDFDPRTGHSVTAPLIRACGIGNLDMVQLLLHSGAKRYGDIHILPIALAMEQHHIVRYLEKTKGFCSRLHYALELPPPLVLELIRSGADLNCASESDRACGDLARITPIQMAEAQIHARKSSKRKIPSQLDWIMKASKPWSMESHFTFPIEARQLATSILMLFATRNYANIPTDVWTNNVIPFAVSRGSPLSRKAINAVWPGDGRSSSRFSGYLQYQLFKD